MAYQTNRRTIGKQPDNHRPIWWVLVSKYGLIGACRLLWTDVFYDLVHRIDTARPVGIQGLDKRSRGADCNRYVASTFDAVSASLAHLLVLDNKLEFSQCGFVDIGSGKGKALIAASRLPFCSLSGFEIDKGLHQVSVNNIRSLGLENRVALHRADASYVHLAPHDRVLYFFNPFTGDTLRRCLDTIACNSLNQHRYIVYLNPTEDTIYSEFFDKLDEVTFSPGAVEVNYYRTRNQ